MNFSQRFGLFILIAITISYVYFSFFNNKLDFSYNRNNGENPIYNPVEQSNIKENKEFSSQKKEKKEIKIFLLDKNGNLRPVNRVCDLNFEKSCFEFAIKELTLAPTKVEKAQGFTSEIPVGTRVLSIREAKDSVKIDLSSNFEAGGGAESTYMRVKQIIKTANSNTSTPTYLYINGKQANVIGGEGIMIKQPLNERSFDE